MNNNCIFCKIINKEIPAKLVYEDDEFFAMLDIAPATKGHVLVLPKEHATNMLELSDEKLSRILIVAKKIVNAMKQVYNFTDFNIIQNNGEIAGQSVGHYHLHIIPRYDKNEIALWNPHEGDPSVTDELANKVCSLLL